jgi:dTDP-glucose pyrophosphorylase
MSGMKSLKDILVRPGTPILQTMQRIDTGSAQIVLVIDENDRLIGAVTDGDIRRAILGGVGLDSPIATVMNPNPTSIGRDATREEAIALMRSRAIHQIPVIDGERRVVDLITLDDVLRTDQEDSLVVLMAGGVGSRLRPLTEQTPKPLLPIGGRPLLEITISNLARQGFGRFFVSVNYKASMFRDHFAKGQRLGVEIDYLEEEEKLGTAGALRLLPERPKGPVLVINGDILTNLDARRLIRFHRDERVPATMCVRSYEWRVPYGVVQMDDGRLAGFEEKPIRAEFVNAGIYVLSPEALDHLPPNGAVDMPTLFSNVVRGIGRPAVYVLNDYWLDIGHMEDLQRARDDIALFQ